MPSSYFRTSCRCVALQFVSVVVLSFLFCLGTLSIQGGHVRSSRRRFMVLVYSSGKSEECSEQAARARRRKNSRMGRQK